LKFFIKPTQLAGMTATLYSYIFPDEKQVNIFRGTEISQPDVGPISSGEGEFRRRRTDRYSLWFAHSTSLPLSLIVLLLSIISPMTFGGYTPNE
jgi:hypothetical protein